jgi:hypothetical protein
MPRDKPDPRSDRAAPAMCIDRGFVELARPRGARAATPSTCPFADGAADTLWRYFADRLHALLELPPPTA